MQKDGIPISSFHPRAQRSSVSKYLEYYVVGSLKTSTPLDSCLLCDYCHYCYTYSLERVMAVEKSEGRLFCHYLFYCDKGKDNRKVSSAPGPNNLNMRRRKMAQ